MNPTLRVALHGFSDFEQRALGSFFRLAAPLALELVPDIAGAQMVVADADHPGTIAALLVAARVADTVFIGTRAPQGAAALLSRPIDALHVLREIEALAARRRVPPPAAPEPAAAATAVTQRAAPPAVPRRRAPRFSALLVDDSAIALRHLQLRLQPLGMDCDLAPGSARALELLAQRAYGFVFIDVELGEGSALDGLALCQHIKRQHRHVDDSTPVLVLVSAHHSEVDRARGAFAGCDHYLAKPVEDEALRLLLSRHRAMPASHR
ncbi:MAG: response regulator [Burkholderiaceae bacterium]|nr:response regulator [Burkholderiaceae bacterium]